MLTFPLLGTLPKQVTTSLQVRQAVKLLGQAGKAPGIQPGKGPSRLPRGTVLPPRQTVLVPGMAISHLTPLIGSLKGLPQKTPTLSGSLNLSSKPLTPAQRSVLAKGPNFVESPKQPLNLGYITAIEAAGKQLN